MSSVVAIGRQTRWKDSYASSSRVNLTVCANGENSVSIYTTAGTLVDAGFAPPTVAPTITDGGAGVLPAGYLAYAYVYASSQYPGVDAVTTAGGFLYPKSNPSPASAVYTITASHQNLVTVTKSERGDVDTIFVYRTAIKDTSAEAQALADAGEMFYVGFVEDNGVPGTTIFIDNVAAATNEILELDNYVSAQFQKVVYESPYWWGFCNPELDANVTIDGTTSIAAAAGTFFSGRQNQFVTFDGNSSGGFDGKGTFYFKYFTDTLAHVSLTIDGAATIVPFSGTTVMRVRGYAATLYRSKPNNPFAWGLTNYFSQDDGGLAREPEQYAFPVGGRGSAIAVMTTQRLLKLDVENPNASYVLNLGLAGEDGFEASKRRLDGQYSIAAHDSQYYVTLPDGSTALAGIDAANKAIVLASSASQNRFGSQVVQTVNSMVTTDDYPRKFHGVYDPFTELSLFWIKTCTDPDNLVSIDTCLCFHAPSGQWSTFCDFDVTASASIYDPDTLETLIFIGTKNGKLAQAFVNGVWNNLTDNTPVARRAFVTQSPASEVDSFTFLGSPIGPTPSAGQYFDCGDTVGVVRVWLNSLVNPAAPPAIPAGGRLLEIPNAIDNGDLQTMVGNIGAVFLGESAFTNVLVGTVDMRWTVVLPGNVPAPTTGTIGAGAMSVSIITAGSGGWNISSFTPDPGAWALFAYTDPANPEVWQRANSVGYFDGSVVFDPATNVVAATGVTAIAATGYAYIGIIDCEARTYFQPDQTRASQVQELWGTFSQVGSPFYRFYEEFSETQYGADMPALPTFVTESAANTASFNRIVRDVPSVLVTSFGLRVVERTYTGFTIYGLDLKTQKTR